MKLIRLHDDPTRSARAVAADLGVSDRTIRRTRTAADAAVEKTTGRDGKARKSTGDTSPVENRISKDGRAIGIDHKTIAKARTSSGDTSPHEERISEDGRALVSRGETLEKRISKDGRARNATGSNEPVEKPIGQGRP